MKWNEAPSMSLSAAARNDGNPVVYQIVLVPNRPFLAQGSLIYGQKSASYERIESMRIMGT